MLIKRIVNQEVVELQAALEHGMRNNFPVDETNQDTFKHTFKIQMQQMEVISLAIRAYTDARIKSKFSKDEALELCYDVLNKGQ